MPAAPEPAALASEAASKLRSGVRRSGEQLGEKLRPPSPAARRREAPLLIFGSVVASGAAYAAAARRPPVQCALDVAVPLEVAYEEWMRLDFLPEGVHQVKNIARRDDILRGTIGHRLGSGRWEAEIRDERDCESFAWRSRSGSDCAGLITFHQLAVRLTRLELQLDLLPRRPREAFELAVGIADRRAMLALRRFKAALETISPEAYGDRDSSESDH
jgi:uncharacterized membrane protein